MHFEEVGSRAARGGVSITAMSPEKGKKCLCAAAKKKPDLRTDEGGKSRGVL